jgi:2-dehydro-3-deoxyphosphooctonate aldolase (KDO 8-P synthase)
MQTIIAGPCVIEHSAQWLVDQAGRVKEIVQATVPGAELIFKASFDKANRSTLEGARGIGIQEGLEALADVRKIYGIRVTTDVHTPEQAYRAAGYGLILQIPAMLARQTDLVRAAARSGAPTTIKVPVWADHTEALAIRDKYIAGLSSDAKVGRPWLIYRGTQYGPGPRGLRVDDEVLRRLPSVSPTLLDITHTNRRSWLNSLSYASGVDHDAIYGLFMETHPKPSEAWCDGLHQLSYAKLAALLEYISPKFFGGQVEQVMMSDDAGPL